MSARKLADDDAYRASKYDVIGTNLNPDYTCHLSLLSDAGVLRPGSEAKVYDMGPPLRAGQASQATGEDVYGFVPAHAVGWIDNLDAESVRDIETWLSDIRTRIQSTSIDRYVIAPPWDDHRDRKTQRIIGRKFSCAGFVLCCYEEGAGIRLLDFNPASLPPIGWETLELIYDQETLARLDRGPAKYGLTDDPPWRIVLCGYVLHALNRASDEIRSRPHKVVGTEEAIFPLVQPPSPAFGKT